MHGTVEELSGHRFMLKYRLEIEEDGESLVIHYWEVSKMVSSKKTDCAVFNFTILASQEASEVFQNQISEIEKEIKRVRFADANRPSTSN